MESTRLEWFALIVTENMAGYTYSIRFFRENSHDKDDSQDSTDESSHIREVVIEFVKTSLIFAVNRWTSEFYRCKSVIDNWYCAGLKNVWNWYEILFLDVFSGE